MKRIQMVLAALAIVVTSLAAFSVPAMADDLDCRDAKGDLIRCDGDLYAPYSHNYYFDNDYDHDFDNDYFDNDYFDNDYFDRYDDDNYYYFLSPYNYYGGFDNDFYYYDGCEGPVCLID
jgi:hypothetical protein